MTDWGPLAEPFHVAPTGTGGPTERDATAAPWRENAFLSFFDATRSVCGAIHCSTSPTAPGRARASVVVSGRHAEVVEPLGPLSFAGEAIQYDLAGIVRVQHPALSLELVATPRFVPADYTLLGLIPPLPGHDPLSHHQQGADIAGWVEIDGERLELTAHGFRDRTWGFRDESAMFVEYLALAACLDGFDITVTKFLDPDGGRRTGGYRLTDHAERVLDADITRTASGLLAAIDVRLERGKELSMRVGSSTGFWAPMGVERRGPTLAAYEECVTVDGGGAGRGTAVVEHGILRRLF